MKESSMMKRILFFIIVLSFGLFSSLYIYSQALHNNLENEVLSSLQEVSGQSVEILRKEILGEINLLDGIANEISDKKLENPKKLAKSFQKVSDKYRLSGWGSFLPMGPYIQATRRWGIWQTESISSQGWKAFLPFPRH